MLAVSRKLLTEKDFHKLDGAQTAYVQTEGTFTDFSQGRAKLTGNPLDEALEGKGFLEVLGPQGVRYTRHGSFKLNPEGMLVTTEGLPVLSPGGGQEAPGGKPVSREELMARAIRIDTTKAGGRLTDRKSTRLNSSHVKRSRMPSSA